MNTLRRYHFASAAQWGTGELVRAAPDAAGGFGLVAPWGAATAVASTPCLAVSVAPGNVAIGNDGDAHLWIDEPGAPAPERRAVPQALAMATHIEAGSTQYWACDDRPVLRAYVPNPTVLRLALDLGADGTVDYILDLSADGNDGVWVLAVAAGTAFALQVDCSGLPVRRVALPQPCGLPRGLTTVGGRLVVLDVTGTRLHWLSPDHPGIVTDVPLASVRPGGVAMVIASDTRRRVVLGGVDAPAFGARAWVASADADGQWLETLDLDAPPLSLACSAELLLVTSRDAVWRFAADASGNSRRSEASARFTSPQLVSPPIDGGAPWLRAEVQAWLPRGCSVELRWAGTDDVDLLAQIAHLMAQAGLDPALRRQLLDQKLGWSPPVRFEAIEGADPTAPTLCALPLHDVRTTSLWISLDLLAAPGAGAPRIASLDVLYPEASLMQYLPAIYRRDAERQPYSFLRILVAALETTVQGLDARIATLHRLLDANDAPEGWLDAAARWLGIPWDDALDVPRKRALLSAAPALLEHRGTRAGVQTLLAALLPPRRARVVDVGVEHGFARLAGARTAGALLPALLPGWPTDALVLGTHACLGMARLGAKHQSPGTTAWLAGRVDVEILATPDERHAWSPWLGALLAAMTPLTARVRLHWRSAVVPIVPVLDDALVLGDAWPARLGGGASPGHTRLEPGQGTTLGRDGPEAGFSLY